MRLHYQTSHYLRWDSLGEFLALGASLEEISQKTGNKKFRILAKALSQATGDLLNNEKSPSRRTGQLDNRGSHFYLALYWAQALVAQTDNADLSARFAPVAKALADNEHTIVKELGDAQGDAQDIGGYYMPNNSLASKTMRPSPTLNNIVNNI